MNYKFHPKLVVRTPIKPLKTSFEKSDLKELFSQTDIQEALLLSSPDLLNECFKWLAGHYANNEPEENRIIFSLLKYTMRMHSRCTPFGLLAGTGVSDWRNHYILDMNKSFRKTRLDMSFTCSLAVYLSKQSYVRPYLKFYPNTSIYYLHNQYRYIEYYFKNKARTNQISSIESSEYLKLIIDKSSDGLYLNEMIALLVADDISAAEAEEYIYEVIDSQLLISELEPSVTGEELLFQIIKILGDISQKHPNDALTEILVILSKIGNEISTLDNNVVNDLGSYFDLINDIEKLGVPFMKNNLFQTDLFNVFGNRETEINDKKIKGTQSSIIKALRVIKKLNGGPQTSYLSEFKEKFLNRYGQQERPLLEVLDNEFGIGYGDLTYDSGDVNPLLNDLIFSQDNRGKGKVWNRKHSFLLKKIIGLDAPKNRAISIKEEELEGWDVDDSNFPVTTSVIFSIVDERDEKALILIKNGLRSSAVNLLGRFAASSSQVNSLAEEITEFENKQFKEAIMAEVVHIPEGRVGNVLFRPSFTKFEIPYLSKSPLSGDNQISVDDLYISIRNNQLYLRSRRLNKQIIPRLASAHNFSYNSLPVYHFLCDMQLNGTVMVPSFDWGLLKNEFKFLPRVEVGNVIISQAMWQLSKEDFMLLVRFYKDLVITNKDNDKLIEKTQIWKSHLNLPDLVLFVDHDNELLINLTNELNIKMFISIISNRQSIVLKEFLYQNETCIKDIGQNSYANEFIATLLLHKEDSSEIAFRNPEREHFEAPRNFGIGSEWLYYKFYCGINASDNILTHIIYPLTLQFIEQKLIDKWFFIRYVDPEYHLRVRFHLTNVDFLKIIIDRINEYISEYLKTGIIRKIQIDTYEREIERYGITNITIAEDIFYFDSRCFLEILNLSIDNEKRWLFAIKSIDVLLDDFELSMVEKRQLMYNLKSQFSAEFGLKKFEKLQIDKKYRDKRDILTAIIVNGKNVLPAQFINILNERSEDIKSLVVQVRRNIEGDLLSANLDAFLSSIIHMFLNRVFRSKQRTNELIIYDFMWRTYNSTLEKFKRATSEIL